METSIQVRLCVPGPSGLATGSPAPSRKRSGTRGIALAPASPTGPLPGTRDRSVRHVAATEACDARVGFNATHEPDSGRVTASTSRRPDTARVYDSSPLRWAGQSPTDSTFHRPVSGSALAGGSGAAVYGGGVGSSRSQGAGAIPAQNPVSSTRCPFPPPQGRRGPRIPCRVPQRGRPAPRPQPERRFGKTRDAMCEKLRSFRCVVKSSSP